MEDSRQSVCDYKQQHSQPFYQNRGNNMSETQGKYEQIATAVGKLVDEKNKAYGNSFMKAGDFLKILYPDGII